MRKKANTKTDQLRVRLTRSQRERLEKEIARRGKDETISDVIRDALYWLLSPLADEQPVYVDAATMAVLAGMAKELRRDVHLVARECVQAVKAATAGQRPLIVRELELAANYAQETAA